MESSPYWQEKTKVLKIPRAELFRPVIQMIMTDVYRCDADYMFKKDTRQSSHPPLTIGFVNELINSEMQIENGKERECPYSF